MTTRGDHRPPAEVCRANGWAPGTYLTGDEGYGPTVLVITAVGEREILARVVSQDGNRMDGAVERSWRLDGRDWREVEP